MTQAPPQVQEHQLQAEPQSQPPYIPPWLAVQQGPLSPIPLAHQAPPAPIPAPPMPVAPPIPFYQAPPALIPVPPVPVMPPVAFYQVAPTPMPTPPTPVRQPMVPPPFFFQAYPPGGGPPILNYSLAPAQPYQAVYLPTQWPPYQQYFAGQQGAFEEDSKTIQPDKFTSRDPSKLCPFIVSCIMTFDSRPCKFATNH